MRSEKRYSFYIERNVLLEIASRVMQDVFEINDVDHYVISRSVSAAQYLLLLKTFDDFSRKVFLHTCPNSRPCCIFCCYWLCEKK